MGSSAADAAETAQPAVNAATASKRKILVFIRISPIIFKKHKPKLAAHQLHS
jgi:hypothetical protein